MDIRKCKHSWCGGYASNKHTHMCINKCTSTLLILTSCSEWRSVIWVCCWFTVKCISSAGKLQRLNTGSYCTYIMCMCVCAQVCISTLLRTSKALNFEPRSSKLHNSGIKKNKEKVLMPDDETFNATMISSTSNTLLKSWRRNNGSETCKTRGCISLAHWYRVIFYIKFALLHKDYKKNYIISLLQQQWRKVSTLAYVKSPSSKANAVWNLMAGRYPAKQNCQTCELKYSVPSLVVRPEVVVVVLMHVFWLRGWNPIMNLFCISVSHEKKRYLSLMSYLSIL